MSGIYIPDMKMPKDCRECPFFGYTAEDDFMCLIQDGADTCRLEELPPHGRLGDLDELEFYFDESAEGLHGTPKWAEIYRECAKAVREAETIIPADPDGGADNGQKS